MAKSISGRKRDHQITSQSLILFLSHVISCLSGFFVIVVVDDDFFRVNLRVCLCYCDVCQNATV